MHAPNRRPAGFTLIELLVVISILAVLSALGAGAYFRVRAGQQAKTTEETLSKINTGLNRVWSAELDNAKNAFDGKGGMSNFAAQVEATKTFAGDNDRARALWTYLWMKNAFPQTFAEARANTNLTTGASLPPRSTFTDVPAVAAPAAVQDAADQAAVLLYKIVTQKGSRGETFGEEAVGALGKQVTVSGFAGKVFVDTYGNPITFLRFAHATELDQPIRGSGTATLTNGARSRDPLDPTGTLVTAWTNKTAAQTNLGVTFTGAVADPSTNTTVNWIYTLVSRGSRGADDGWTGLPMSTGINTLPDDAAGFIYGYKLRRQGARGDQ